MDRSRIGLAKMDRSRLVRETIADKIAFSQSVLLRHCQSRKRRFHCLQLRRQAILPGGLIALRSDSRRHWRFLHRSRVADWARHQPPVLLRAIILAGTKPGFENMALRF